MEELKTKEQVENLLIEAKKSEDNIRELSKHIRIAPSRRKILQLPKELLLKHNALIFHKGSSLSSTQRKLVQERVAYGLNKGLIEPGEVALEINKLNTFIQGELTKNLKDDSITNK